MKTILSNILAGILYISIFIMAIVNVIVVGYFLYLWGAQDIPLASAAWSAFLAWLSIIGGAFLCFVGSLLGLKLIDD